MINILETAQGNELKTLIEICKELLEQEFGKQLMAIGIQESTDNLTPLDELVNYSILSTENEKEAFKSLQNEVWNAIKVEVEATSESWQEAHFWFVDRMVYTFLNRLFAIRVMEAHNLLKESTLVPQADLGNRSARMARIQEVYPDKTMFEWLQLVLRDVFGEIGKDVRILFDEKDVASRIWPEGRVIEQLIQQLNAVNPEIYQASDIIGWFYHYYVLKARKGHKTMSSHGSKSPANPNYLSILNTVYTPRWMVRVLVDNSLGHWWQIGHPDSRIFLDSPFFIQKVPVKIEPPTNEITNLRILDPACGSGNFLVYTFGKLVEMYKETFPDWSYSNIVETILDNNLFGIDINRRPAQLSALALFISARNLIKIKAPAELATYKMPVVNILCCDIRIPNDKSRVLFIQQFKDARIQKVMKDVVEQFDNADQLGSLIDIQGLQAEINKIKQEKKIKSRKYRKLDTFMPNGKKVSDDDLELDLVNFIESEVLTEQQSNIGIQIFGRQAKNAASLAQVLMRKYDIIMGNPPFGFPMDATKQKLRHIYPNTYADLVSAFIDQSYRLLKENGFISMVSDFSFMHLPKFEKFRQTILLSKLYIQYLLVTGLAALPDARNVPILFILRKNSLIKNKIGLYRYVEYSSSQQFIMDVYIKDILDACKVINSWSGEGNPPRGWNRIDQSEFLNLPRCVIDLSTAEKFKPLLEFFTKYPRLDISQHTSDEKNKLPDMEISRAFNGCNTGKNDLFVKYWFELPPNVVRKTQPLEMKENIGIHKDKPFIPFSKGGGDNQYYLANPFILWWNSESLSIIESQKGSALRNLNYLGIADINWPFISGKPRGRFCVSQEGMGYDTSSMSIKLISKEIDKFALLAYLNSKLCTFFCKIQTSSRMWQAGYIARLPVPINFIQNKIVLKTLSEESFLLRRDWDTGYPMSPIFSESLIDKVIKDDTTIFYKGIPKTKHLFCNEYLPCTSDTALKINKFLVDCKNATVEKLLDTLEQRFNLLTKRLNEIDDQINKVLYDGLLDVETTKTLDQYFSSFIGKLGWQSERDIWLKDFVMTGLIDIIKAVPKGIIPLNTYKEDDRGFYERFIELLCKKFDRDINSIQPLLKELEHEQHLGKNIKRWIVEDFFFYHCQRFGGRPIIWQFSSRSRSNKENALDLFVDYQKITENTLPNIRVEYIEPLIRSFEQRKGIGMLPKDDVPRIDELEELSRTFVALETGYPSIPNPNALTGNKSQKGKGDDKTWEWVFGEATKIICNGYKPDHFLGVLVNILPLCLDLPEAKQKDFPIKYQAICPKGTLKHILKKLDALDQLRNVGSKEEGEEEVTEEADQTEGKKKRRKKDAANEDSESNEEEANDEDSYGEDS